MSNALVAIIKHGYRSRFLWIVNLAALILLIGSRFVSFYSGEFPAFFAQNIIAIMSVILFFSYVYEIVLNMFSDEISFFSHVKFLISLGMPPTVILVAKAVLAAVSYLTVFALFSVIIWELDFRYFLIGMQFACFLLLLRLLFIFLNPARTWLWLFFTVSFLLFAASFYIPVFIVPNSVYIMKSALMPVILYVFLYCLFYFVFAVLIFSLYWRKLCFGRCC